MTNFEQKILAEIEEREMALLEIERVLFTKRYKLSKTHFELLSVQSISMVYAIWEGFIQKSFQMYISVLNEMQLNFTDFAPSIQVFHTENMFKQFQEYPQKEGGKVNFYTKLKDFYNQPKHTIYSNINTNSNVSFEVLNKLLETFKLNIFPEYWENYQHPTSLEQMMKSFLRYRNGVAHGGDISSEEKITQEVYNKYKNLVKDLMYAIHGKMMQGLQQATYKK